jgi:hypothetical protein
MSSIDTGLKMIVTGTYKVIHADGTEEPERDLNIHSAHSPNLWDKVKSWLRPSRSRTPA